MSKADTVSMAIRRYSTTVTGFDTNKISHDWSKTYLVLCAAIATMKV